VGEVKRNVPTDIPYGNFFFHIACYEDTNHMERVVLIQKWLKEMEYHQK
jgi:hypothetical protein